MTWPTIFTNYHSWRKMTCFLRFRPKKRRFAPNYTRTPPPPRLLHNAAISTDQFRSVLKTFLWSWKEGSKKFQVDCWRFTISTLLLLNFAKKRLNWAYFSQKMDFFQVFQGQMKILMVVLKSVTKMRWTIREEILKNKLFSKFFFFRFWNWKIDEISKFFFF